MLTDPRAAFGEQNTVATALTGVVGLARLVQALAAAGADASTDIPPDDLVYLLLGLAGLSARITDLAADPAPEARTPSPPSAVWLR